MSSPHKEKVVAQISSGDDSEKLLPETSPSDRSLPSTANENLAHQPGRAEKMSVNEDSVTVRNKLKKGRKHSREEEETNYQETAEKRGRAEKRSRSKSTHKNEKGDEGNIEEGGPSKSCVISQETSHKNLVSFSLSTSSGRLSRSRSAVSLLQRKTKEVSTNDEGKRYLEKKINNTLLPTPEKFKSMMASVKAKWIGCCQKAAPIWANVCRTARIVYDRASFILGLFVAYFLKYLIMFLILVLLMSTTHRTICEIPSVRYHHPSCTAVWAPTSLPTDPQQDYALSQLAGPMQHNTEFLNQMQGNEYLQALPMALFESSQWMRSMQIVLHVTSPEGPSKEGTVDALGEYAEKSEKTGEDLSELWTQLSSTVHLILLKRMGLVRDLEKIQNKSDGNSALASALDVPGILWSFVATSLLGRPVLTPYQARQMKEEQARIELLREFFPYLQDLLDSLEGTIRSAQKDFRELNSSVYKIQGFLFLDITKVSLSRDLLSLAESHPYQRFRALFGGRQKQRLDLRTREAQLELLSATNATVTVTLRELITMADVVRKLQNDLKSMKNSLRVYESSVNMGRVSVDGLLQAVKTGVDALARGRLDYRERERKRNVKQRKDSAERVAQAQMELQNLADKFHQLAVKQGAYRQ